MAQFCIEEALLAALDHADRRDDAEAYAPSAEDPALAEGYAESRRVLDEYRAGR